MAGRFDLPAGLLTRILDRLADRGVDLTYLMARVEAIITEDHTRSILMGIDKDGVSFKPVTYRGDSVAHAAKRNKYNRGVGPALTEPDDNLSTAQYRRLTGPPLAPRGKDSRIIANFATRTSFDGHTWKVQAVLVDVVDRKGRPFMQYHFAGAGRLPRRDDRGIRPWGREEIRKAMREEVRKQLAGH
jgi:hypothetical protein